MTGKFLFQFNRELKNNRLSFKFDFLSNSGRNLDHLKSNYTWCTWFGKIKLDE